MSDVRLPSPTATYDPRDQAELRRALEAAVNKAAKPGDELGLSPKTLKVSLDTGDNHLMLVGPFSIPEGRVLGIAPGSNCVVL